MAPLSDPTAHAEIMAIRTAGTPLMPDPAGGAYTLYTSGEPCLMCVGLVLLSPINTVVWAAGPIVLSGSAWDAVARSGFNAARVGQVEVIREPDPEMRTRSRKLLFDFLTARGDHPRRHRAGLRTGRECVRGTAEDRGPDAVVEHGPGAADDAAGDRPGQ